MKKKELNIYQIIAFFIFFLFISTIIIFMIWDFLSVLAFSLIITGCFYPVMEFIVKNTKWKRKICALITCLLIILLVFVPAIYIVFHLSREILNIYDIVSNFFQNDKLEIFFLEDNSVGQFLSSIFQSFDLEYSFKVIKSMFLEILKFVSTRSFNYLNTIAGNVVSFIGQSILVMLAIYAFLLEGKKLKNYLIDIFPMKNEDEEKVLEKLSEVNQATIIWNGIGGIIQGILAGFGFWIAGIESVLSLTLFMIILAFIPLLGISIIYLPTCIYLIVIGQIYTGIILLIYCTIIALTVENWFKPRYMGKKINVNSLLILFSMLFGMNVFGVLGLFYGPLIISVFLTTADLYLKKYRKSILEQSKLD